MGQIESQPQSKLVLIHTVPPLIQVFNTLAAELLPGTQLQHILDEPLLERVRRRGHLAGEDIDRLRAHVILAEQTGANAVLVTCSTLSAGVDTIRPAATIPVGKIDEAMVAEAVQRGSRIGLVATSATTLEPTRRLLQSQAGSRGTQIEPELVLVEGALPALLAGNGDTHDRLVKQAALELARRVEVIVFAQASMARVVPTISPTECRVPILSSPHLALKQLKGVLAGDVRPEK
jgi:Asp/Glu/hydantoin racemase